MVACNVNKKIVELFFAIERYNDHLLLTDRWLIKLSRKILKTFFIRNIHLWARNRRSHDENVSNLVLRDPEESRQH